MSHPIENIMHSSMQHIKSLADVNTVIGDPMMTDDNTMILPVSKVSLGLIVGGGEYLALPNNKKERAEIDPGTEYPFIGASTVGMCLTPLAFLAVQEGSVRVLPAKQDCPSDRLIDIIPQLLQTAERMLTECKDDRRCSSAGNKDENGASVEESKRISRSARSAAEKARNNADKAESAAERAYDTAIEASRAADIAAAADKANDNG